MNSIRRNAFRTATSLARATSQNPSYATSHFVLAQNAARCFTTAAPRALAQTSILRDEQQNKPDTPAPARTQADRSNEQPFLADVQNSLYVENLAFNLAEEEIAEAFSKFGVVKQVFRPEGQRSKWTFVVYEDAESVKLAAENVDGTFWHGRRLRANPRKARAQRPNRAASPPRELPPMSKRLFVGGIPHDATDAEFNDTFSSLEGISGVKLPTDRETGWPLGYAFLSFHSIAYATAGMEKLQGVEIRGSRLRVEPGRTKEKASTEKPSKETPAEGAPTGESSA